MGRILKNKLSPLRAKKTNLQVKPHLLSEAPLIFQGTGVTISCVGQQYLGSVIGEELYVEDYVREKVEVWKNESLQLIHIAESQPHAAFACFVHRFSSKWVFLSRTVPNISSLLDSLESLILTKFYQQ